MKTSHLIILLVLFFILVMFVNNPLDIEECFTGDIHHSKKKLTKKIMDTLASNSGNDENINSNRYQKLYESGRCTPYLAPKIAGSSKREILGRKLCYCAPGEGESVGNGWILAKNMPLNACSKNDFTRY